MFRKHIYDFCNLLTLGVTTFILLVACNADVLYTAQSRSLCMSEFSVFMQQVQHSPDGLLAWVGCWFTQLFYYPWIGASALFVLWCIIYFILAHVFAIPSKWRWLLLIPLFSLLISEIDLGYWIYYLKHPGYWFRETIGLLCVSLLLWLQPRAVQNGAQPRAVQHGSLTAVIRNWAAPVIAALSYLFIGWYALLALLTMAVRNLMHRQWATGSSALLLGVLVPPAVIRLYSCVPMHGAWTVGFPYIVSNQNHSLLLTTPFIIMAASVVLLSACQHWPEWKKKGSWIQAAALVGLMLGTFPCNFSDHNYHAELEMYRDMEEFRWDRLIRRFNDLPEGPTRQMVMCKNLALINLKHLGDGLFMYPNIGADPAVNKGLEMHMVQTAAPMFYLQHGLTNDAIHWCIENSVEYGLTINDLRIMTLASIIGGETRVARKYINMLRHTMFGSIWAKRYFPLTVHPEWIEEYPELQVMKELHDNDINYLVGDLGDCEFRIYRHFANTLYNPNHLFQEVCLAYALMLKNTELGLIQLNTYREYHRGKPLPQHYQEAASLFQQMQQGTLSRTEIDQMIEPIHGKTYKWFFFKVNDAKTY